MERGERSVVVSVRPNAQTVSRLCNGISVTCRYKRQRHAPSIGLVWIVNRNRSVRCGIAVVTIYLGRRSNCVAKAKIPQQVICT